MAATQIAVVYSIAQQIVRRVIGFDDDSQIAKHKALLLSGEGWAQIDVKIYQTFTAHEDIYKYLELTGVAGVSDRCVLTDNTGKIIYVLRGDPEIDMPNGIHLNTDHAALGGQLVLHPTAVIGGTLINGVYAASVVKPDVQS